MWDNREKQNVWADMVKMQILTPTATSEKNAWLWEDPNFKAVSAKTSVYPQSAWISFSCFIINVPSLCPSGTTGEWCLISAWHVATNSWHVDFQTATRGLWITAGHTWTQTNDWEGWKDHVFLPAIQATHSPRFAVLKAGKRSKWALNLCTVSVFHCRERTPS